MGVGDWLRVECGGHLRKKLARHVGGLEYSYCTLTLLDEYRLIWR